MVSLPQASYYLAYTYGAVRAGLRKYCREKLSESTQVQACGDVPFSLLLNHLLSPTLALTLGRETGLLTWLLVSIPDLQAQNHRRVWVGRNL